MQVLSMTPEQIEALADTEKSAIMQLVSCSILPCPRLPTKFRQFVPAISVHGYAGNHIK